MSKIGICYNKLDKIPRATQAAIPNYGHRTSQSACALLDYPEVAEFCQSVETVIFHDPYSSPQLLSLLFCALLLPHAPDVVPSRCVVAPHGVGCPTRNHFRPNTKSKQRIHQLEWHQDKSVLYSPPTHSHLI